MHPVPVHELVHEHGPRAVGIVAVQPPGLIHRVREIEHLAPRVFGNPLRVRAGAADELAPLREEREASVREEEPPPLERGGDGEVPLPALARDEKDKVVEGGELLRVRRELAQEAAEQRAERVHRERAEHPAAVRLQQQRERVVVRHRVAPREQHGPDCHHCVPNHRALRLLHVAHEERRQHVS